jgi:hypothetical protein
MDRNLHVKHIPVCKQNVPPVSQYMWPVRDTNIYMCENGIYNHIYDCDGNINYSLPLEMYPHLNKIHPEVYSLKRRYI